MRRFVTETRVGESKVRYRTRIEDDPSSAGSDEARVRQGLFVRQLVDNWPLLSCGYQMFEKLSIFHNGNCWVAEAEAVAEEPHV